jgi:hypothetical protein
MLRRASQLLVAVLIAALAVPAQAAEHLVTRADLSAKLAEAAAARQTDLADLGSFLNSPAGQRCALALATDATTVRSRLAQLSDAELADLAQRARAVNADLRIGYDGSDVLVTLVILAVAAVAFVVLLRQKEEPHTVVF